MRPALLLLLASCAPATETPWAPSSSATRATLPSLAATRLPPGDAEVRFWIVPSFGPARGVVIRKSGSDFHALVIDRSGSRAATPTRSWNETWDALTNDGIFTLPDDSSLPNDGQYILDGVGYTVEVQRDGAYRSYSYGNPAEHDWPEATRVLHMAHVLARAFRVRIDDRSPKVRARVPDEDVDASSRAMGAPCDPFDMSQSMRCGANGRVAVEIAHGGARAGCVLEPVPPPNRYGFSACVGSDRVYLASSPEYDTLLVADVAEMTDDQRVYVQKKMGITAAAPLRTIAAWRAALR